MAWLPPLASTFIQHLCGFKSLNKHFITHWNAMGKVSTWYVQLSPPLSIYAIYTYHPVRPWFFASYLNKESGWTRLNWSSFYDETSITETSYHEPKSEEASFLCEGSQLPYRRGGGAVPQLCTVVCGYVYLWSGWQRCRDVTLLCKNAALR